MEVGLLGPLQVVGAPLPDRPAQRRVLALLALEVGRSVDRSVLVDRLWDAPPRTAVNTLQAHVSGLRRQLGDRVVWCGTGYRLDLPESAVDAPCFTAAADHVRTLVRAGAWTPALDEAEAALRLWRGDPVPELDGCLAVEPTRVRLQVRHGELRRTVCRALLELDEPDAACAELECLAEEVPHDEAVWAMLMAARARAGRRVAALEAFHTARSALAEVGCAPGARLATLQHAILTDGLVRPLAARGIPVPLADRALAG